ncbi:MAG: flagellar basal body rod protein FlgB [Myxococcales bacterium]|nr:flagellar basal body rod protein FlgB [Myxococcales bacterium]
MRVYEAVDQMQRAMTFHRNRHSTIAGNIANLDTPGYKPMDLERLPANSALNAGSMARTDDRHIAGGDSAGGGAQARTVLDSNAMQSADGNAVNIEREMAKIDANRVRYSTTSDLVSRRLAMLRYAASDGAG